MNFLFIIDFHAVSFPQCDGKMEDAVLLVIYLFFFGALY